VASRFPPALGAIFAPRADLLKIITKYVLREHLTPLVFSLSALTSLLLLNYVAKRLGELVGKDLPWTVIAEFLLLSVPFTVAMTLPMAVLVSTLHAFSRLASENEITAFKASGLSMQRLMWPIVVAGMFLTVGMVWFNDQVLPAANHRLTTLTNDIARKKPTFALREQVINEVSPGKIFLRAVHLDRATNRLRDVTIYDLSNPQTRRTIRADSGLLGLSADQRDLNLTLFDGQMVELSPQTDPTRLQRMFFRHDLLKVRGIGNSLERDTVGGEKSDREMTVCELQRRVERSAALRDSSYGALKLLDPKLAKKLTPRPVSGGMGALYCRALYRVADARATPASSAMPAAPTAPAAGPAKASIFPFEWPAAPIEQAPVVQSPQPSQSPQSAQNAQAAPAYQAPMATPIETPDPGGRSVLAEGIRLQMGNAQQTIDGNQVEIEKKFAIAAACTIFVLLGAPIALRFPRGGVGMTIGVSLGVFGLYYVGLIVGESLARRGLLSPFLAMWAANFILLVIGGVLTARLGREGTTSRGSETSEFWSRLRQRIWRSRTAEVS
jgi:lipopolysaccharide export system permease protein